LDLQLARYLPHRNGTYVEIGANDGIQQSNTKYFESFRGWSGILIEPYGDNFLKLKRNRSRRNYFVNCACVDFSYIGDEINLIYSDLMTTSIGLDTDLKSLETHILQSEKFLKRGSVHTFHADARTMNSILLESPLPNLIDLLSLDVEGAELSVLKGIDHKLFRFRYILVECREITRMKKFLKSQGYFLVTKLSAHDYLFENKW
jgi:FkbM family methyltransferase